VSVEPLLQFLHVTCAGQRLRVLLNFFVIEYRLTVCGVVAGYTGFSLPGTEGPAAMAIVEP
jgi:hypothetical protein